MLQSDRLTIQTLIDNTSCNPMMMAEWGLSIFIDTGDKKILFDTGAGNPDVLLNNMAVRGLSVTDIDVLVLSHGHMDHTGGLRPFFRMLHNLAPKRTVEVFCHPAALAPQFVKHYGSFGCPYTPEELSRLGARFHFITEPYMLTPDVFISGRVPMSNNYESVGAAFYRPENSPFVPHSCPVEHEQLDFDACNTTYLQDTEVIDDMCLYLRTELGAVVILGCAHRGIINSLEHAVAVTGCDHIYMVIGGTHLAGVSQARMEYTVEAINRMGVQKIGVSHCTGQLAAAQLYSQLGEDRFFFNNAGSVIRFSGGAAQINKF